MKTKPVVQLMVTAILLSFGSGCDKSTTEVSPEKQVAWVVGQQDSVYSAGVILYSEDAGDTWIRQGDLQILEDIDILNVIAVDRTAAWAVGTGNSVFRTSDGGKNWEKVPMLSIIPAPDLLSVSTSDGINIWISGANIDWQGVVYKSSDGGNSWTLQDTTFFNSWYLQGIYAITPQVIYVVGYNIQARGFIARTKDGGITWDSLTPPGNYNDLYKWIGVRATDTNHVCIYGQAGHYILTSDGFLTWMLGQYGTGGVSADFNCLVMIDDRTFWVACDYNNILYSDTQGSSWVKQVSNGTSGQFLVGIDALSNQVSLITGQSAVGKFQGNILKTTDGGSTWVQKYYTNRDLYKVSFAKR